MPKKAKVAPASREAQGADLVFKFGSDEMSCSLDEATLTAAMQWSRMANSDAPELAAVGRTALERHITRPFVQAQLAPVARGLKSAPNVRKANEAAGRRNYDLVKAELESLPEAQQRKPSQKALAG